MDESFIKDFRAVTLERILISLAAEL